MAMVLFKPEGIAGIWQAWRARAAAAPAAPSPSPRRPDGAVRSRRPAQALRRPGRAARTSRCAFEEGELSGIMGPNGAGKTTCFNVLTGRYAPDRGSVTLRRRATSPGCRRASIARQGISRSFQVMNLFDDYTRARQRAGRHAATCARRASMLARPAARQRRAGRGRRGAGARRPGGQGARAGARACPTASGARWRSAWRWPPSRACCSSTSRPRASAPRARRAWPTWSRELKRAADAS